ncbi:isoleucine--tRNA ligase, partial [Dissulfurirhabdus thermomarina]
FPDPPELPLPDGFEAHWERVWALRAEFTKALELARTEKRIGLALDAGVRVRAPGEFDAFVREHRALLETVTLVSALEPADALDPALGPVWKSEAIPGLEVQVRPAPGEKCPRCWTWRTDLGADPAHPEVCGRCAGVLAELAPPEAG